MNVSKDSRRRSLPWSWVLAASLCGVCLAAGLWLALGRVDRREAMVAEALPERAVIQDEEDATEELPGRVVTEPMQGWSVAYSPDGKQIAVGVGRPTARGELQLWDAASGKLRARSKERRGVASVAFSPNGDLVAGCNWENVVKIYRADTLDVTVTIPLESPAELAGGPQAEKVPSNVIDQC